MSEEENKGQEPEGPPQILECPVCGREREPREPSPEGETEMPPSVLIIRFAGPGSAQILQMASDGIVTFEQMGAAGQFLACRAYQEWTMPLIKMVVKETVEATIAHFLEEMNKPRIETPPFFIPGRGGPPV